MLTVEMIKAKPMGKLKPYVASFQTEPFHKGRRYHWIICRADNAEELVSWGHEPTRELAETAAEKEIQVLSSHMTRGGQVVSTTKPFTRRALIGATKS